MTRIYCSTFNGRLLSLVGAVALIAGAAAAQNVTKPDCIIDVTLTAAGQSAGGVGTCGNNINGVYEWRFNYKSTGFTALSVEVQSAPDNAGAPGTWVPFAGTVTGSNPNTATTQASSDFVGFYPWVRVFLTSKTGTGTITGQLYGCRQPGCSISGATITAIVAIPNPLPVDGPDAAGAAPTHPPVLQGGQDGAPGVVRVLKVDANGSPIPSNTSAADSDGINNTELTPTGAAGGILYPRVFSRVFNGTTWDRARGNTNGAFVQGSVASGGANAGNPVKIGGPFNTTQPTVADGQMVDGQFTARGTLKVTPGVEGFPVTVTSNAPTPTGAATAQADGATNSPTVPTVGAGPSAETVPSYPYKFNGATWDRDFTCPLSAPVTFTAASGSLQIVAASGSTIIRICHVSIAASVATNITLQYGTGSNCGTGTNPLTGAYNNVTQVALDLFGTLRTPASQALCIVSSASVTAGGVVTYAQF